MLPWYFPATHAVHDVKLEVDEYLPVAHIVQLVAPVPVRPVTDPVAHVLHEACPA